MTIRERSEMYEKLMQSPLAALSSQSRGRDTEEAPCEYRTCYQRDRDRILHSKSFRRLKHKTQVFLAPEGDHYRTRLTHTLEVSQIARTIACALLLNEDLTEAISLGHDLGHTPFGHAGERALNEAMGSVGGFRHYQQSVRVVNQLEKDGKGLNLTWEVRNGINRHTCGEQAVTLEGQVVRFADRIAYINHDIDDAIRAGVLTEDKIPDTVHETLGNGKSIRIHNLVTSIVENSGSSIGMDPKVLRAFDKLHDFMFEEVYRNPIAKSEEEKISGLINNMFEYLVNNPDSLPDEFKDILEKEGAHRAVCDYIAGMTDNYALDMYNCLFIPRRWQVKGINFTG
ncbi:MAG: deoxyguanosinetriphosphate triphosphohydrolase [Oscillospiraceae bacterium]|nr:deoxyguanosinetriphosphate triphosphohydrolase [Oscillospiraceae bacterium]